MWGFEVYLKLAKYYMDLRSGKPVDIFSVQEAVAEKGEIFLGFKKNAGAGESSSAEEDLIVLNPNKLRNGAVREYVFTDKDEFVVLAEDMTIRE